MPLQATSGAASYDAFGGGVAAVPNYIEDVFSTYLYTGNGSTQTINNGIDLAGKGGLVWGKNRSAGWDHYLADTAQGVGKFLSSNLTSATQLDSTSVTAFNSNGFSIGNAGSSFNDSGQTYASWTFRKQPKFFDVVTYTGTGTASQTVSHNLGSAPGCIIIKRTDSTSDWFVGHTYDVNKLSYLNTTAAATTLAWNSWQFNTTTFRTPSISGSADVNVSGATYVAYLFAHDAGGFGLTGTDNVISCGSLTTSGTAGLNSVTLGYEPQFVMLKRTDAAQPWITLDIMRGMSNTSYAELYPNNSNAESASSTYSDVVPKATGFDLNTNTGGYPTTSSTYIYIAIRRGPMKVPTDGTKVFKPFTRAGNDTQTDVTGVGFTPDLWMVKDRTLAADFPFFDRLRGVTKRVVSNSTNAEETFSGSNGLVSLNMDGITIGAGATDGGICNDTGSNYGNWLLKRAPGFFDEVCYTGTGSATTFSHNLGAVPELMIVKKRSAATGGSVYSAAIGNTQQLELFSSSGNSAAYVDTTQWNSTTPTSTVFTVGTNGGVNGSGSTYVNYLFATCPGVSKVTNFTGNGTSQTINCGFTSGARFVMIKATSTTGNWTVFDSARGISAGGDPALYLNSTAAEVTGVDAIDADSTGFIVNQEGTFNLNASGVQYLVLAIS